MPRVITVANGEPGGSGSLGLIVGSALGFPGQAMQLLCTLLLAQSHLSKA